MDISTLLLLMIPLVIIQFGLMIAAVLSIIKQENFKMGSRNIWLVVAILVNIIGPILYFILGKGDE